MFERPGVPTRFDVTTIAGVAPSVRRIQRLVLGFTVVLVFSGGTPAPAQPIYSHLRIVVPANPGGGWDVNARAMQPALHATGRVKTSSVENIPGAGGTIGLARFVSAERGNGDVVMVSGLTMLGAIMTYGSLLTFADVTPIARVLSEYEVVVVPANSSFQSMDDVVRAFKANPESIAWGGGSTGGCEQMLAWLIAEAVGVDPRRVNYVAFAGNGESIPAILGGQVTVGLSPLAAIAPHIEAGMVRVLGISSSERVPTLDAPTLREQGVNVELENWKALFAPPGVTDADRERLEASVASLAESAEWRQALERYRWNDRLLTGPALLAFIQAEESRLRAITRKIGGSKSASAISDVYPATVLMAFGALMVGFILRVRRSEHEPSPAGFKGSGWTAIVLILAGAVIELTLMESLGFVVASAVLFWLTARAFDSRHPLRDAASAIAVSTGAYLIFARLLDLSLPTGVLAGWL
jgi:putative tricarboxylic transport membrane protein